jgi:hypothetical protein|tara:strand:- start:409 stop:588 length:180 start_codon:yes stop_codon:yes gene_type:complete
MDMNYVGGLPTPRPELESGISKACRLRAEMKGAKLVRQIADGIELSEDRKMMREMFGKL